MIFVSCLCITVHTSPKSVSVIAVTTTIGNGGGVSSEAVIGGVVGGIGVAVFLIRVVIVIVTVVRLTKKGTTDRPIFAYYIEQLS